MNYPIDDPVSAISFSSFDLGFCFSTLFSSTTKQQTTNKKPPTNPKHHNPHTKPKQNTPDDIQPHVADLSILTIERLSLEISGTIILD